MTPRQPFKSTPRVLSLIDDTLGFSVAEAVIATAFFAIVATSLISAVVYFNRLSVASGARTRAVFLAEEGLEAVRNLRDNNFSNLTDATHGLAKTGDQWAFSGASDTIDGFTRQLNIASLDSDTKKIISQVAWRERGVDYSVSLIGHLTNWQKIVKTIGDWSSTTLEASLDLPSTNDGRKIQVIGDYAYVVRADGTPDFIIIDISDPANPFLAGSLSLVGAPTNIFVSGGYAYVSSDDNNGELKIINVANPAAPALVGVYDAPGAGDGNGIYIVGTNAYLVGTNSPANPDFLILNVSDPANPTLIGSLKTGQVFYEVVVSGNYAYISTGDKNAELRVANISNLNLPTLAGNLNLPGNIPALTLSLSGSTLFVGQGSTLYSIDIATPASPLILGSLSVGGTLNDIALNLGNGADYLFVATSDPNNEFKVIDVRLPAAPVIFGQADLTGSSPLLGAAYDTTLDRAFLVGQSAAAELMIMMPH